MAVAVMPTLGRLVILTGTGLAGTIILKDGRGARFVDLLKEFQEFMEVKGAEGSSAAADKLALARVEMDMLVREIQQLRIPPSIIRYESGNKVLSALIVPAAAAGVAGYAYMWWKGITFSSLMYVTKQNMANAVSSMTKHLEQVQTSLAAAKRHLTQRIQRVDDKLDKQKEISGQIRDEVTGAREKLQEIGEEFQTLKKLAFHMDGKLDSIQDKQNCQNDGVDYLLKFIESNGKRTPDHLEGLKRLQEGLKRPVVTRSFKQPELPGLEFGLRLLALDESWKGAGLALPPPVKAVF
ncbi:hypothetical protein ACQ4PT_029438 [Festuca glaucescens]